MSTNIVQSRLREIGQSYRQFELWRGLAKCWAAAAAIGLCLLFIYPYLSVSPQTVRRCLIFGGLLAAALVWRRFATKPIDLRRLAREIENDHPKLNTLLLAAVEQEPDKKTGELNFLQHRVIEEAIEHHRRNPWSQKTAERLFFSRCAHFACLIIFLAVCLGFRSQPKQGGKSLATWGRSGITVTPGDVSVERGSTLPIMAQFTGKLPAEVSLILIGNGKDSQKIPLVKSLDDPIFGGNIPELTDQAVYHVEYAGEKTRDFKIGVFDYPDLRHADVTLTYPEFTRLPQKKIEATRRVSAVEGTKLDYTFHLNKPVASAFLVAPDKTKIPLAPQNGNSNVYAAELKLDKSQKYSLLLSDQEGRTNKLPAEFVLDALKNNPPKLRLAAPGGDPRVSPLEEISFEGEVSGDFGITGYGLTYTKPDGETKSITLGSATQPNEKRKFQFLLPLETIGAKPDQLVSYFVWADDFAADGKVRRTSSDMYFAEVRPFDQIFRQGDDQPQDPSSSQGQPQQQMQKLTALQKDIISATWKLQRRETEATPSPAYKKDVEAIHESQQKALEQAEALKEKLTDGRLKDLVTPVETFMKAALGNLKTAAKDNTTPPLPKALKDEQSAYQALLKLQAREFEVSKQNKNQNASSTSSSQQRDQKQLDELELKQTQNRYETKRQANAKQAAPVSEEAQFLNRLKELAKRQDDINQKLKELQTALQEAKTEQEREDVRRQLKRLRDDQKEMVQDMDEMRQKLAKGDSPQQAQALSQLDQTREQARQAAQQMEKEKPTQALAAGTRAEQNLQQLRDDFRKSTSNQFSEDMREMRSKARDLAQKEEEIGKKLETLASGQRKTLSDSAERKELGNQMDKQRSGVTNLLQSMREVTEQAETVEPLLAKELYDAIRSIGPQSPDQFLNKSSELLGHSLLPQASQLEQRARTNILALKEGVERAANNLLGDDTESLKLARNELKDLEERIQRELAQSQGQGQTSSTAGASVAGGTNSMGTNVFAGLQTSRGNRPGTGGTNNSAQKGGSGGDRSPSQPGGDPPGKAPGDQAGAGDEPGQQASNGQGQKPGQGQGKQGSGQQGGGDQPGKSPGQQAGTSPGQQPGSQPGSGNQPGAGGKGNPSMAGGEGTPPGQAQPRGKGPRNGPGRLRGGGTEGGGTSGEPGGVTDGNLAQGGPLTGQDFRNWSDRLGDVQEMVDLPDVRDRLSRIGDQAKLMRSEYKRAGKKPDWAVVKTKILDGLVEVRNRINEELAKRESNEALVPIDRDPVPGKYAELVRQYYEQLGKGGN